MGKGRNVTCFFMRFLLSIMHSPPTTVDAFGQGFKSRNIMRCPSTRCFVVVCETQRNMPWLPNLRCCIVDFVFVLFREIHD
jgi:hypothetical protein